MYVCRYVCLYVRMYVCMHIYIYMYVLTYVCMCVCMYVCMYVYMYVCTYVYIYVYTTTQVIIAELSFSNISNCCLYTLIQTVNSSNRHFIVRFYNFISTLALNNPISDYYAPA
jgi:hypothetical protein